MCSSPILIKNPRFGHGKIGLNALFNCHDSYIKVPCGSCPQCASMRQGFFNQRVQMESLRSHLFMFTLTYNDESLVYASAGDYTFAIPYLPDVQNMFKRLRKMGHRFRVTYCSEYGSRRHRPHFHGILALDKSLGDPRILERDWSHLMRGEWRRNTGSTRSPLWSPLFTPVYKRGRLTTFDFHYIEPVLGHDNDVSFYVSKYITKYDSWTRKLLSKVLLDDSLTGEESQYLYKSLRTRCNTSKDFGDWKDPQIWSYICKCANVKTSYRYPQFVDIYTGNRFAMSPYYGKHVVGFEHAYDRLVASDFSDEMSTGWIDQSTVLEYEQSLYSNLNKSQVHQVKLDKMARRLLDHDEDF